jgi:formylglycine-generating enzyme required for sulfatase activity
MPPEAWAGEPATSRSDVYSLGALLYVLGANARPHRGDSPEVMREAVLARDTLPLAVAVPGIDARFAAIVDRCLRRDPAERFASGDDVREALEALAGDDAPVARVLAQAPHVRPALQRRWAVLGVVLALVLAFFAYPYVGGEPSRHPVHAAPPTDARPQARTPRSPDTPTLTAAARSVGAVPGGCPEGMVPVPAGTFQMGSPEGEGDADEHPQHEVTLPPYCIDRTEVTVAAYAECVAAKGCRAAPLTVNSTLYTAEEVKRYSGLCNRNDRLTYPINCVDWNRAAAYCTWQSKRLPSEAEWEYAARGKGDRVYPWGNEAPNAKRLNMWGGQCVELATHEVILVAAVPDDSGSWDTTPVGRYPDGRSPFGALDMAGNVWEWTADWYGSYATQAVTNPQGPHTGTSRVTRGGGSFELSTYRIADRNWPDPEERAFDLGFRCARGR